jgi:hypothetical protein
MENFNSIYFVRNETEARRVIVYDDGSYRIETTYGYGKLHENFAEYHKKITENGWRESSLSEYLRAEWYYYKMQ